MAIDNEHRWQQRWLRIQRLIFEQATVAGFEAFLTKLVDPFGLCRAVALLVGRSRGAM